MSDRDKFMRERLARESNTDSIAVEAGKEIDGMTIWADNYIARLEAVAVAAQDVVEERFNQDSAYQLCAQVNVLKLSALAAHLYKLKAGEL